MDFHFLDLIMYFVLGTLLWILLPKATFKEKILIVFGIWVMLIYTIIFIIIFAVFDNNFIDILNMVQKPDINFYF